MNEKVLKWLHDIKQATDEIDSFFAIRSKRNLAVFLFLLLLYFK